MIFVAVALLMLLAAIAAVTVPLWRGVRRGMTEKPDPEASTHALQLAELQRDLATGVLADVDFRAALHDIEMEQGRRIATPKETAGHSRKAAMVAGLFVTVASVLLYGYFGNWRVGAEGVEDASVPAVEQMVANLSARLHSTDANDLQGWEMLGHAYVIMQRYPDAVDAYRHAYQLAGDTNAAVLAGYAEAITLANPGDFMAKALPLFEKTLKSDPNNAQALWYGGVGAFEHGDNTLAIRRWQALLAQNPPAQYRAIIDKYIVKAGGSVTAIPPVQSMAVTGTIVRVHVSLAPSLRSQVRPDETLFVFALPAGVAGGPPLAVRRFTAGDLPLEVSLTDQDAPMPGRNLSSQDVLQIIARISRSGSPEQQAGDFVGKAQWSRASAKSPDIVIDAVIK